LLVYHRNPLPKFSIPDKIVLVGASLGERPGYSKPDNCLLVAKPFINERVIVV